MRGKQLILLFMMSIYAGCSPSPADVCDHWAKASEDTQDPHYQTRCVDDMKALQEELGEKQFKKFAKCTLDDGSLDESGRCIKIPVPSPIEIRRLEEAEARASQIHDAFGKWRVNSSEECPESLQELGEYLTNKSTKDPWGNEFRMRCGDSSPVEFPFGVTSDGPDGKPETGDELESWPRTML